MKYLVLFGILLVVYLLWRHGRQSDETEQREHRSAASRPASAPALPQEMVQCPVCAVHLPRGDALVDASGRTFCCPEHRMKGNP